jgi:ABC-2 type transport system permease protein
VRTYVRSSTAFRNLIRELAVTDFKLKYQGSVLGYAWSFAKPLLLFLVLYFVFTRFVRIGGDVPNYGLYLLLGIVLWSYFADATLRAMSSIVERADLIRKVYFPRIIIVIATSVSSSLTLLFNLLVVAIFLLVARVPLQLTAPLILLLLAELYVLTLGCSFFLAAVYVRFRDFRHIWEVGQQLLFYASPVIYPLQLIPTRWIGLFSLNPIAQILQDARKVLITPATVTVADTLHWPLLAVPYLIPVVLLPLGYSYFKAAAARFAEEL